MNRMRIRLVVNEKEELDYYRHLAIRYNLDIKGGNRSLSPIWIGVKNDDGQYDGHIIGYIESIISRNTFKDYIDLIIVEKDDGFSLLDSVGVGLYGTYHNFIFEVGHNDDTLEWQKYSLIYVETYDTIKSLILLFDREECDYV